MHAVERIDWMDSPWGTGRGGTGLDMGGSLRTAIPLARPGPVVPLARPGSPGPVGPMGRGPCPGALLVYTRGIELEFDI